MVNEVNGGSNGESKHSIDVGEAYRLRQEEHLSDRQIAHRLGVSRVAVWKRLRNYQPTESVESAEPPKLADKVDTRAELDKFLAGVPKSDSLRSYLHEGNFAQFKQKVARYNELAQREDFSRALELVHGLRRKAGWGVLSLEEVQASDGYRRLNPLAAEFVELLVTHQIAESDLTPQQRASGDGRYLYNLTWE